MNNINILMSVNKAFLEHSEEMIYSLLYYSSRPITIYMMYIEQELKNQYINRLKECVSKTGKRRLSSYII